MNVHVFASAGFTLFEVCGFSSARLRATGMKADVGASRDKAN